MPPLKPPTIEYSFGSLPDN